MTPLVEGSETIFLSLRNPSNGVVLGAQRHGHRCYCGQ